MRFSTVAIMTVTFAVAAALAVVSSVFAVDAIERVSKRIVTMELVRSGLDWAEVDTDGLQVFLYGTAPDEAERFTALSVAGTVVDTARLIDQMLVEEGTAIAPPRFSMEILRNEAGVSLIGLVPASTDRDRFLRAVSRAADGASVSDFLEVADHPAPDGWDATLDFARDALDTLPRSKISITEGAVAITAVAPDDAARRLVETELARTAPEGVALRLDVTAPRPVIAPFALRFELAEGRAQLDPCAADSAETRDRILQAARVAGLTGPASCRIGLGVPDPAWGAAAAEGIAAVGALGGGRLALTNTDMRLTAPMGTAPAVFDRVTGDLQAALPEGFALAAVLPPEPETPQGEPDIPDFTITRSPEGSVQLRGRLPDALVRATAESLALAAFGTDAVRMAARVDPDLPGDWALRSFAAIEALALLTNGAATVTPDRITVSGRTGSVDASAAVTELLTDKLGQDAAFDLDITYLERLDPATLIPTPQECKDGIVEIIGDRKIIFEPGSATLDASAQAILDDLAELLVTCEDLPLEIGGHTDSQGREIMNQELSRERAQAVLDGLRDRLVPVRTYTVVGYGETQPIADNDTEEGREINRRIEFTLIRPEPAEDATTTLDAVAEAGAEAAESEDTDDQTDGAAEADAETGETPPAAEETEDE